MTTRKRSTKTARTEQNGASSLRMAGPLARAHVARDEIFGPVLSVMTFRTPAEAIEKANNTPYGLSAGIWSEKGSRILWMAQRLRAGVVWANTYNRFDPTSPFGGYRESGFGREGGRHGLEPYLRFDEPITCASLSEKPAYQTKRSIERSTSFGPEQRSANSPRLASIISATR